MIYHFPFTFLDDLISICQSYHDRVKNLENEKYDMEKEVEYKDYKVWPSFYAILLKMNIHIPPFPFRMFMSSPPYACFFHPLHVFFWTFGNLNFQHNLNECYIPSIKATQTEHCTELFSCHARRFQTQSILHNTCLQILAIQFLNKERHI